MALQIAAPRPGQHLLVHAGAGGVGSTLIQLGKKHSVKLIATVGSDDKVRFAEQLGANLVLDYNAVEFGKEVLEYTSGGGVDAIFDGVGAAVVHGDLECLADEGMLLYYGSASGHPQFPGGQVLTRGLRIQGFVIFSLLQRPALWKAGVDAVLGAISDGSLRFDPEVLPMASAPKAHSLLESRSQTGKIVLDTRG